MYNRHECEVAPVDGDMSPELDIKIVRSDFSNPKSFSAEERQLSKKYKEHTQKMTRAKVVSKMKEIVDPRGPYLPTLNKIFLTSWVIAVITDPFFLYIPTLNQEKKCLRMDKKLEIIALVFRSFTDLSYVLHIIFQLFVGLTAETSVKSNEKKGFLNYAFKRAENINWSCILLDVLAVLPVPQVIILVFFSKIRPVFRPSSARKILLYIVLLFQYVPRVFQIYLSCDVLKKSRDALSKTLWVRGAFNLFLYIIASHILGAFWYFFSVEQETTCWQYACKNQTGCLPSMFNSCNNDNTPSNLTFVNDFCPTNPPKTTDFDFGIFLGAIQSGIVASTDFPRKVLHCFWWGLRNLSSFGSNLEASSAAWENCFAALISMLGLLIFLYLIGNLQLYMQLPTQRSEDRRHNRKEEIRKIVEGKKPDIHLWASHNLRGHDALDEVTTAITAYLQDLLENEKDLDSKKQLKKLQVLLQAKHPATKLENGQHSNEKLGVDHPAVGFLKTVHLQLKDIISGGTKHQWSKTKESAQLWMLKNGIPKLTMLMIKQYIQHRLQNSNDDVDIVYLFSVLPIELQRIIKRHLCPKKSLKKVPELQNIDDQVYEEIIKHLKPVSYAENSYIIREGEPIGHMLFVIQGVVWVFGNGAIRSVAKGDHYGEQLLEWQLRSASYTELPVSTKNVQSHTKVEALVLKAVDLNHILSKYWWKFPIAKQYEVELLKRFAAGAIREAWQRCRSRRQKDPSLRWTVLNRKITSETILVFLGRLKYFSGSWEKKFLNAVLLFQFVPRIFRIYLSCMELTKTQDQVTRIVWFKGGLNFFLFILASHIPTFQNMNDLVLEAICNHAKPVIYNESSYIIREGDPLDRMLFMTQGTAWAYKNSSITDHHVNSINGDEQSFNGNSMNSSSSSRTRTRRLKRCDYFGEELLQWSLTHNTISELPISTTNVKSRTKVEAFAFMASDLMNAISRFWRLFLQNLPADHSTDSQAERWETSALSAVLMLRRDNKKNKTASSAAAQLAEGGGKSQTFKYQQLHH